MPFKASSALFFFFFNDTATTEIYTLSLHDALPILDIQESGNGVNRRGLSRPQLAQTRPGLPLPLMEAQDRKSTRLNSSHANISYAVFCLKKKKIRESSPLCAQSRVHTH